MGVAIVWGSIIVLLPMCFRLLFGNVASNRVIVAYRWRDFSRFVIGEISSGFHVFYFCRPLRWTRGRPPCSLDVLDCIIEIYQVRLAW